MIGSSIGVETDLEPNDRVVHVRDASLVGTVTHVEGNRLSVMVCWDGDDVEDFQWANKVEKADR